MVLNQKGFYFSFDAILALGVMTIAMVAVIQTSGVINDQTGSQSDYQNMKKHSLDALMTAQKLGVNEQISTYWRENQYEDAREIAEQHYSQVLPENYDYELRIKQQVIVERGDIDYSELRTSTSIILSSVKSGGIMYGPSELKIVVSKNED